MIPRTPAGAVLWECWRLSRGRLLTLMILSTLAGGTLIATYGGGGAAAVFALLILVIAGLAARVWSDIMDNRSGFGLVLGFARPIRSWVLVVVPMIYIGITGALTYLVPASLLRVVFDVPFPLFPIAAVVAALTLAVRAAHWWTAHSTTRMVGRLATAAVAGAWILVKQTDDGSLAPARWSEISGISFEAYAGMFVFCAASIALTVFGVARQRRGDDIGVRLFSARDGSDSGWTRVVRTVQLALRRPCPTSSPARAQLWYETHAMGGPIVLSGFAAAASIALLVALIAAAGSNETVQAGIAGIAIWAAVAPMIIAFRRVLGLRRKQGSVYLGSFDGTRAMSTGRLVAIRVGVATAALLVAFTVVALGAWASLHVASMGDPLRSFVGQALDGTSAGRLAGVFTLIVVHLAGALALWGVFSAWILMTRNAVIGAFAGFFGYVIWLVYANYRGWLGASSVTASFWGLGVGIFLGSIYLLRRCVEERVLPARSATVIFGAWVGLAVLQLSLFPRIEVLNPGDVPLGIALAMLAVVAPLAAAACAPWSVSRLRHR